MQYRKFSVLLVGTISLAVLATADSGSDPCADVECGEKGTCVNGTCECVSPQFQGPKCDINTRCPSGYLGISCEIDVCKDACQNNGTCVPDKSNEPKCTCPDGYQGNRCENVSNPVTTNAQQTTTGVCDEFGTCKNGGSCVTTNDKAACTCADGFEGEHCETAKQSADTTTAYEQTASGPVAARVCTADDGCKNGGSCVTTNGKAACTCADGFEGELCETAKQPDVCKGWCLNNGTCVSDKFNKPECTCPDGYQGNRCENVSNPVTTNAQQTTTESETVAGCTTDVECENDGSCKDKVCQCQPGYEGEKCEIDVCKDACQNGGTCIPVKQQDDSYKPKCTCPEGYLGDSCETPPKPVTASTPQTTTDVCKDACQNGGTCKPVKQQDESYKPECTCPEGYLGDSCETPPKPVTESTPQTTTESETVAGCTTDDECENDGSCKDNVCQCQPGYEGEKCEIADTDSEQAGVCDEFGTCKNGGSCVTTNDKAACKCADGFEGEHCETDKQPPKDKGDFEGTEEASGSRTTSFMAYFLVFAVLCIVAYIGLHNRKKIMGLVIEGGGKGRGGRSRTNRPSSKDYARLEENVSDSLSKGTGKTYIF